MNDADWVKDNSARTSERKYPAVPRRSHMLAHSKTKLLIKLAGVPIWETRALDEPRLGVSIGLIGFFLDSIGKLTGVGVKRIVCALALATATIASPAAAATLFTFDTGNSFVLVNSNTTQCLGSCDLTASVISPLTSFSLDVGQSYTFDFARFIVGPGFGTGSATIDAQLAFLTPGTSSAGTGGDANYLRLGGFFTPGVTAGSLIWDTPSQQVTTSDGTVYTVSFGSLTGAQFGGDARAPVTVRLDSAVPEPSTWAMMILGFGMIAFTLRRRNSRISRPAMA